MNGALCFLSNLAMTINFICRQWDFLMTGNRILSEYQ